MFWVALIPGSLLLALSLLITISASGEAGALIGNLGRYCSCMLGETQATSRIKLLPVFSIENLDFIPDSVLRRAGRIRDKAAFLSKCQYPLGSNGAIEASRMARYDLIEVL